MIKNEEISTKSWKKNPESTFQSNTGKKLYGEIEVLEVHFLKKKLCVMHVMNRVFQRRKNTFKKVESSISWFKDSVLCHA